MDQRMILAQESGKSCWLMRSRSGLRLTWVEFWASRSSKWWVLCLLVFCLFLIRPGLTSSWSHGAEPNRPTHQCGGGAAPGRSRRSSRGSRRWRRNSRTSCFARWSEGAWRRRWGTGARGRPAPSRRVTAAAESEPPATHRHPGEVPWASPSLPAKFLSRLRAQTRSREDRCSLFGSSKA